MNVRKIGTKRFAIYMLIFYVKFILFQYFVFKEFELFHPLFNFLIFLFLFSCFELFIRRERLKVIFYIITSFLLSIFLLSATLYHDYFNSILTYHSFLQIGLVGDVKTSIVELFRPIYLLYFFDLLFIPMLLIKVNNFESRIMYRWKKCFFIMMMVCSIPLLCALLWFIRDEKIVNGNAVAKKIGFINYQFYLAAEKFEDTHLYEGENQLKSKIEDLKGEYSKDPIQYFGAAKDMDIIVIQLEAFQNFVIDAEIDGQQITPNINKLIGESFYFPNFFQQVGKGNTSDAEFIMNTSLLPVENYALSEHYSGKDIPSLPKLLKKMGYTSYTFHTNSADFWNRENMYKALGFDRYYDKSFFPDEEKIAFGPSDRILYENTLDEIVRLKEGGKKLYINLISMSSHHPFEIPDELKVFRASDKLKGSVLGNYLEAVSFADAMLGKFIEGLKEKGLYDNTLLVLYGDHFGVSEWLTEEWERDYIERLIGSKYNRAEILNVPLIIRVPGLNGGIINQAGGQSDIMPTIANLVGLKLDNEIFFGRDLLNTKKNVLPEVFYMPKGTFINDEILFVPGDSFSDGTAYSLETHEAVKVEKKYEKDFSNALKLLHLNEIYLENLPDLENQSNN